MKFSFIAAALIALVAPAAAEAATIYTFDGTCTSGTSTTQATCSSQLYGTYGNSATIAATNDATLKMKVSAWQANQSTGVVTTAYLGAYSGGFGVTGVQDVYNGTLGGGNTHQIDNVAGYTDFVVLQFNTAVHLEGVNLNLYQLTGVTGMDSDLSIFNDGAITPSTWNNSVTVANNTTGLSGWTNTAGTSTAGYRAVTSTGFSQVWLVAASLVTTDRNDGFKLAGISVTRQTPAVPEPATWAMMIMGFGFVGASLRRRRADAKVALA